MTRGASGPPSSAAVTVSDFVTLGAQRIHVHTTASPPGASTEANPVVLLHSGGFTSRQWRRLVEALSPTHRVVAPDLIGYGQSTPIAAPVPFHFREDLAILDALLVRTTAAGGAAHLVGHSYGGFLALLLALARPDRVRSLALYEPVAFGALDAVPGDDVSKELGQFRDVPNGEGRIDDAWLEGFIDWWNGPLAWQGLGAETKAAFRTVSWKVFQEVSSLTADTTPLSTYATIAAPTLLIGGNKTPSAEQRVIARLARAMPHARLEVLEGVGHMGPITHAATVNRLVVDHIEANRD